MHNYATTYFSKYNHNYVNMQCKCCSSFTKLKLGYALNINFHLNTGQWPSKH